MTDLAWFKSSYSSSSEGDSCVEVAHTPVATHVRDSRNPPATGPTFQVTPSAWVVFTAPVR